MRLTFRQVPTRPPGVAQFKGARTGPKCRTSPDTFDRVRAMLVAGMPGRAIARETGLSEQRVSQLKHGKSRAFGPSPVATRPVPARPVPARPVRIDRQAVLIRYLCGDSYAEIARRFRCNQSYVPHVLDSLILY